MSKNNGSNGSVNVASFVKDQQARLSRLAKLQSQRDSLTPKFDALSQQTAALDAEIASLMTGKPVTAPTSTKGRKAASKSETKTPKATRSRSNGNGNNGSNLRSVLLSVLPTPDQEPINKDAIAELIAKAGYTSNASDPKIVIGQNLGKFSDFTNVSRGMWRLSKRGLANRDKATSNGTADANATADASAQTPAPVAPVTPAAQPAGATA